MLFVFMCVYKTHTAPPRPRCKCLQLIGTYSMAGSRGVCVITYGIVLRVDPRVETQGHLGVFVQIGVVY